MSAIVALTVTETLGLGRSCSFSSLPSRDLMSKRLPSTCAMVPRTRTVSCAAAGSAVAPESISKAINIDPAFAGGLLQDMGRSSPASSRGQRIGGRHANRASTERDGLQPTPQRVRRPSIRNR